MGLINQQKQPEQQTSPEPSRAASAENLNLESKRHPFYPNLVTPKKPKIAK